MTNEQRMEKVEKQMDHKYMATQVLPIIKSDRSVTESDAPEEESGSELELSPNLTKKERK